MTIEDRVAGLTLDHYALIADTGSAVILKNVVAGSLATGDRVEVTGKRNGRAFFAEVLNAVEKSGTRTGTRQKSGAPATVDGTLALLHADDFETGTSAFLLEVQDSSEHTTPLLFAALPDVLQPGMHVGVRGTLAEHGQGIVPEHVVIFSLPQAKRAKEVGKAFATHNVLVILMTFTDSPAVPFTQAQVQNVVAGGPGTGSVSEYFKEVSFGQQLLNATVTNWLPTGVATPSGCNWSQMGALGRSAATTAGYSIAAYQNLVYVFPQVSACGWIGLGYIGSNGVWINGRNTTQAYSHELGHNFGLLHAGSLRCSGASIGGSCSVTEYGDPFDVMGNISVMHFNAAQKLDLGWIPGSTVTRHSAGTAIYTLEPLESGGAAKYAVNVPAFPKRNYWLEYRQPVGFDYQGLPYTYNGPQARVAGPFETLCAGCDIYSNDTELLDLTPGTNTFVDAALPPGKVFIDPEYGLRFAALSATSSGTVLWLQTDGQLQGADFDADGKQDLIVRDTSGQTYVQLMNGAAVAAPPTLLLTDSNWVVTHAADFNGDGKTDLIWRNTSTGSSAIWLMNGPWYAGGAGLMSDPNWYVMFTGDFNGDGKADLLWRNTVTGQTAIWLMNGASFLGGGTILTNPDWTVTHVGDFNGDGKTDLLWRNSKTGEVSLWLLNGLSYIGGSSSFVDPQWQVTHLADVNGDGKLDLVWRNTSTGWTAISISDGAQIVSTTVIMTDPNWRVTHVGDLNGDHKTDLIWRNDASGQTSWWLMNGTAYFAAGGIQNNPSWQVIAVVDVNGDSRKDLIWRETNAGTTFVTLMSGVTITTQATINSLPRYVQP